jgi:hypothetical protein
MSTCPQVYNFKISAASKISKQKPCTNIPIQCKLCSEVHWKYNIRRHLMERHPSWETTVIASEFKTFRDAISISVEEESKLGIPEELHGQSAAASEAYDARRMSSLPTIRDLHGDSPQRTRNSTVSRHSSWPPLSTLDQNALFLTRSCS